MKAINFDFYLDIDTVSGKCYWKDTVSKYHRELIGKEAGTPAYSRGKHYHVILINRRAYKRSHIVFWKKNGRMPGRVLDHINGNSLDDRIENLREASYQLNSQNRKVGYQGKQLPIGVRESYKNKKGSCRYQARIRHLGKTIYLGTFATVEEAANAYQLKQKEYV